MTNSELISLLSEKDPDVPVLIDTGEGIFTVGNVMETPHEVFIFLGAMP